MLLILSFFSLIYVAFSLPISLVSFASDDVIRVYGEQFLDLPLPSIKFDDIKLLVQQNFPSQSLENITLSNSEALNHHLLVLSLNPFLKSLTFGEVELGVPEVRLLIRCLKKNTWKKFEEISFHGTLILHEDFIRDSILNDKDIQLDLLGEALKKSHLSKLTVKNSSSVLASILFNALQEQLVSFTFHESIDSVKMDDFFANQNSEFPHLCHLEIKGCEIGWRSQINENCFANLHFGEKATFALSQMQNLESLSLMGCKFEFGLSLPPNLRTLNFLNCEPNASEFLHKFALHQKLEFVNGICLLDSE